MLKIMGRSKWVKRASHGRRTHETLDRTFNRQEAEQLVRDYQTAFGQDWEISVKEIQGHRHTHDRMEQVRAMRANGMTAGQIAKALDMTRFDVDYCFKRLVQEGGIAKLSPGTRQTAESIERDELIVELRRADIGLKAIATALDMEYYNVRTRCYQLKKKGKLP